MLVVFLHMWICSKCKKSFVTKNLWHSCSVRSVKDYFLGIDNVQRKLFDKLYVFAKKVSGEEIIVNIDKTRITFQIKLRFLSINNVSKNGLKIHIVTKSRLESPKIKKVDFIPPDNYISHLIINSPADLDSELQNLIIESIKYGKQEHKRT